MSRTATLEGFALSPVQRRLWSASPWLEHSVAPELPYERLVERLVPEHDPSYNLLVQAHVSWAHTPMRAFVREGLSMARAPLAHGFSPYDLDLNLVTGEQGLRAELSWACDVLDPGAGQCQLARELGGGSRQKLQSIARRGRAARVAAGGDEEP